MEKSSQEGSAAYDAWVKSQSDFFEHWTEAAESFQKTLKGMDWTQGMTKETRDLFGVYSSWKEMFDKYSDVMIKNFSYGVSKDTFSKLFSGADAYVKLFEFWQPLMKALQERALAPDAYKDIFDPSKYREMMNKVFGFSSPESLTEVYGQASKLIETWGSKGELLVKPWSDALQKNIDAYLELASGDPEASINIFHNLYAAFESTFGKAFKLPAVGKDREVIELFLKTIDKYSVFLAKNTEFQHSIVLTGQKAMEKVIAAVAQKVRENGEMMSFHDFFRLWTKTNEKAFIAYFGTEEFSGLQGTVLDAALDARRHFHQLMELSLGDLPIALRSEMDDVYRTVYTLNRNVRDLTKKTAEMDELRKEIKDLKKKIATLEKKQPGKSRGTRKTGEEVTR